MVGLDEVTAICGVKIRSAEQLKLFYEKTKFPGSKDRDFEADYNKVKNSDGIMVAMTDGVATLELCRKAGVSLINFEDAFK
jgi:hypothetical protein